MKSSFLTMELIYKLNTKFQSHQFILYIYPSTGYYCPFCLVNVKSLLNIFLFLFFQVYKSQRLRAGKGKMRNRRRIQKRGPLIIYDNDQVRNIVCL